ncbi:MAG: SGNH/GDSL hydrolase family protein [Alphaproteobacteria bacterium]|nr:SGNH/GDSL hydrolase family protein [Alphaproteobacteria bacterium]
MRVPTRREWMLASASILFACLAAEIGLRVLGISYPIFHRLESSRGWAPWPGIEGEYMEEGRAHISNNQEGYRDRTHPVARAPEAFRIAVLGDSFTEAQGIPLEKTFWSVLGRELSRCPDLRDRSVEVLNFGVTGYGTAQQLVTLRTDVLRYMPDLVLLAFFTGNDVWNNEPTLDGHPDRIYVREVPGGLIIDRSNTERTGFRLKATFRNALNRVVNTSRLMQAIRRAYHNVRLARKHDRRRSERLFDPDGRVERIYLAPGDESWRSAWRKTEATLQAANADVHAAGGVFWLVTLSNPVQIYPDSKIRQAFAEGLGIPDLTYPDRRLADVAAREGFPIISLAPLLLEMADEAGLYLHGFEDAVPGLGHWNETGHRLSGEVIAREICAGLDGHARKR